MNIKNERIELRSLEARDARAFVELHRRNQAFFQPFLYERSEEFYSADFQIEQFEKNKALAEADEKYVFGIFRTDTDELIGQISLMQVVRGALQSCWVGYYLDQALNGRGYTSDALRLVVDFAFNELKLHRVEAGVMPHNEKSIRVVEKAGFEREGLNKKNVLINGKWQDHLHFAVVNPND
ncbi:GNAT family N-acetyltransferase [Cohnella sp. REN36]|uniref:GNAT family N-acetyltransferase n=1 Tax=Cohnella sp. REN36 TaxID=2887347 RepID=UPI001D15A254|nr:GNAT family protein [Cohnella sp. REN36]MCC3373157.1 GNAT family N-acetyltransferase [Cohnella sp. REN36]